MFFAACLVAIIFWIYETKILFMSKTYLVEYHICWIVKIPCSLSI